MNNSQRRFRLTRIFPFNNNSVQLDLKSSKNCQRASWINYQFLLTNKKSKQSSHRINKKPVCELIKKEANHTNLANIKTRFERMISLDTNYKKERFKQLADQGHIKKQLIDVNQTIHSALDIMKQKINKNQHLQENFRKHLLSSNKHIKDHKFEIESIYSKDNTKSQLKHAIPLLSLNLQRCKIRNTLKTFKIQTDYDFSEEKPVSINSLTHQSISLQKHQRKQFPAQNRTVKESQGNTLPTHPSSAKHNSLQSNFFMTNPSLQSGRISQNSFKLRTNDKTKTQISQLSETQCASPQNSSQAITVMHQKSQKNISIINERLQLDSIQTSPFIQPLSTTSSMNTFNNKSQNQRRSSNYTQFTNYNYTNPTLTNHPTLSNHQDQENMSLLSNKNLHLSSSNFSNSNLLSFSRPKLFNSIPGSPPNANYNSQQLHYESKGNQLIDQPKIRASSANQRVQQFIVLSEDEIINIRSDNVNEEEGEEDLTPLLQIPDSTNAFAEGKEKERLVMEGEDNFLEQGKQFYYIDNNEMQSVKEFMYRVNKYEQFKRFEQQMAEKHKRTQQIQEVQQLLLFRSEKAAKEVAKANVRKYIMKHKIDIPEQEVDEWVDKIKVLPLEQNQRLTFRESNRQIISFQLMGSDQEKQFFKIQREIDKALNKINRPVKFIQQYQIYLNNKAKNFQNICTTQNQISMALINQLPSQYLIKQPPAQFFQQNSQSMNKISSMMNIKLRESFDKLSMNQLQKANKVIEEKEED